MWVKHEYFYDQNYTHYIKLGINTKEKLSAREYELFINGLFCLVPRNNDNHTWEVSSYIWEKTAGEGDAMFHFLESDNYFNPMNKWTMPNFYELYNLGEKIIRPGEFIKFLQLKNTNHIGRFNRYMMKLLENYYGYSIKTNYECKTIHENAPVTDDIREFVFQRMNLIDLSTAVVNIAILWWQDLSARMRDGERKPTLKQIQKAIDDFLKDPELRIIAWHCQRYQNGVHTAVVYFFNRGLVFNGREYMLGFENTCTDSSPLPDKIYTMQVIQMLNYEPKEAAKLVDERPGTFHMYKKYLKQMTLKKGDCK